MRLHSPEMASNLLGPDIVTPSWIREMCRRREIDFTLIAGKYALTDQQLAALVRKFEIPAGSSARLAAEPRRRRRAPKTASPASAVTPLRARPPQRLSRAAGDGRD